jgi:murein L,D-transpeptidase YcbB/YkuD
LLNDDKYKKADLEAIVASRETQRISLENTIPVVITYLTAGVDINGNIMFYKDIYNRDQKVLNALNGSVVIELPTPGS